MQPMDKPYAPACDRNREPILARHLAREDGAMPEYQDALARHLPYEGGG